MSVAAFILAGGASSRFGSPKALMKVGDESVLETIANTAIQAFPDPKPTLVMANNDQQVPFAFTLPVIFDLYPERGPLSGLHAALAYARTDWVLALACDYPFLTAELLLRLFEEATVDTDAVVPLQEDGRPQPLCAFYRRSTCLPVVEQMVVARTPVPPLRTIFDRVRTAQVPFDTIRHMKGSRRFFLNVNTPVDLERL